MRCIHSQCAPNFIGFKSEDWKKCLVIGLRSYYLREQLERKNGIEVMAKRIQLDIKKEILKDRNGVTIEKD